MMVQAYSASCTRSIQCLRFSSSDANYRNKNFCAQKLVYPLYSYMHTIVPLHYTCHN